MQITNSATAQHPEILIDVLKTGQNEKFYIFQEIGIPEIHVQLFEIFQNLNSTSSLMFCLHTKNFEWLENGTVLGQSSPNSSGGKICKKL